MWAPCGRKQGRQPGRGRARPGPRSGGRRGAEVREGSRPPGHWGGLSGRAGVALGRRVAPRWAGGLAGHPASEDTAGILGASAQGTAWPAGSQVTCDAGGGWAWRARVGLGQRGRRLPHAGLVGAEPAPPLPPPQHSTGLRAWTLASGCRVSVACPPCGLHGSPTARVTQLDHRQRGQPQPPLRGTPHGQARPRGALRYCPS